ncbi:hypothetical protein BKA69DRAFT_1089443 [Paraphysoderma sedebokerense]|nr:hypothetical protein BKA69DRAFT_1089443 [Paraphysoderma sedebokerense]
MHKFFIATTTILAFVSSCHGHGVLGFPPGRDGMTGTLGIGEKIVAPRDVQEFGGCLNTTAGTPKASAAAGRPLTVQWAITIPHDNAPGVNIGIRCSPTAPFETLASGIDINALKTTVNIPANATGQCEMQWRWSSTSDGGSYIECADINIIRSSAPNGETPQTQNPQPEAPAA